MQYLSQVSEDYWLMDACVELLLSGLAMEGFLAVALHGSVVAHVEWLKLSARLPQSSVFAVWKQSNNLISSNFMTASYCVKSPAQGSKLSTTTTRPCATAPPLSPLPAPWPRDKEVYSSFVLQAPHRYGNSGAIWDHTVLPATRQRWHSRHCPSQLRLVLDLATPEGCKAELT